MRSKLLTAGVTIIWLDLCVGVSCCDCDVNGWLSSPFSYESSIWGGDISMAVCCFLICVAELYGGTSSGSGIDNCANNDCNAKCIEKKNRCRLRKLMNELSRCTRASARKWFHPQNEPVERWQKLNWKWPNIQTCELCLRLFCACSKFL